jgi:hypothetical protein
MKSFSTAAKATAHEKELPIQPDITFEHDGRTVTAHAPTGAQFALFLAIYGESAPEASQVFDTLNFFASRFDRGDSAYFKRRIADPDDPFDMEDLVEVLTWLVQEWSGRPTMSPSDSLQLPTPTGNGSTAGPQDSAFTHSAFGLTGS